MDLPINDKDLATILKSLTLGGDTSLYNRLKIVKEVHKKIPILGVCLGHQIIAQTFNSKIIRAKKIMHGKTSLIKHNHKGIFKGMKKIYGSKYNLFNSCCYFVMDLLQNKKLKIQ